MRSPPTFFKTGPALLWLFLWLAGNGLAAGAEPAASNEYQVKAAFVYNFLKFVEWPAGQFAETNSPIVIGVAGKGAMGAELEAAVSGRRINGRELVVRTVDSPPAAQGTHVLFVGLGEDQRAEEWLRQPKGGGTLTVGESEVFGKRGGMITFWHEGDKRRFSIDVAAASQAGLKISAQLQKLARGARSRG